MGRHRRIAESYYTVADFGQTFPKLLDKLGVVHTGSQNTNLEPQPDRRREHRIQIQEATLISLLGASGEPPIPGTVLDISGSGMRVLSPRPLPCGALVKVEGDNRMILGEVLRSNPEGDFFSIGVKIKHVLNNLSELERLNRELLGERLETKADALFVEKKTPS